MKDINIFTLDYEQAVEIIEKVQPIEPSLNAFDEYKPAGDIATEVEVYIYVIVAIAIAVAVLAITVVAAAVPVVVMGRVPVS